MNAFERIENNLVEFAATVGPWLAPIPTAYLVGRALDVHMGYPLIIAVCAGVVIELLGLSSTNVALTFYEYNQEKRKSDQAAPLWVATLLVVAYFVTATGLTVALDVFPDLKLYAPIIFPTLILTGVGVVALRVDHRRRLQAIADDKTKRQMQRKVKRSESAQEVTNQRPISGKSNYSVDDLNTARKLKQSDRMNIVKQHHEQTGGDFSVTELANELGVSRTTIYNDLEAISSNNGHK